MRSIEIDNIKKFTSKLFADTDFDHFLVSEAVFCTYATFSIDGRINNSFIQSAPSGQRDADDTDTGLVTWGRIRKICYEMIKGKQVPEQFKIVLKYPAKDSAEMAERSGLNAENAYSSSLFLNIIFKNNRLSCTTGASFNVFPPPKTLEAEWDEHMSVFISSLS